MSAYLTVDWITHPALSPAFLAIVLKEGRFLYVNVANVLSGFSG